MSAQTPSPVASTPIAAAPIVAPRASTMRSVIANWAGLGVNALLSLVLTPILVHGLGNLYFGMFMLVASVLDSCWLLDFGMRTAMFRFLARYRGSGEREELDRTFASGMVIAFCSAGLILLATLAAVFLLPRFFAVAPGGSPHLPRAASALRRRRSRRPSCRRFSEPTFAPSAASTSTT